MRRIAGLVLICAGLGMPAAAAPQHIAVGSALVRGDRIEPYRNRFDQTVTRADGTEVGGRLEWTDTVERLNFRGRQYLRRRITTFRLADGAVIADGGAVFDAATFAPRSSSEYQSDGEFWIAEFRNEGREMTGLARRSAEAGEPRLLWLSSPEGAFDPYNAAFGLMLATLPLQAGFSVSYPAVSDDKTSLRVQTATVARSEAFASPRGNREVWVVDVRNDDGSAPATFWISDRPPYVMRIRVENQVNGQPTIFTWNSLEA